MTGDVTMRAAFFGEPGPAEAIEVGALPVPVPGPTDALVAVEIAVPCSAVAEQGSGGSSLRCPSGEGDDRDALLGGDVPQAFGDLAANGPGQAGAEGATHAAGLHRAQVLDVDDGR
jgi:hypothetical protein